MIYVPTTTGKCYITKNIVLAVHTGATIGNILKCITKPFIKNPKFYYSFTARFTASFNVINL